MELNKKGFVFSIIAIFIVATAVLFALGLARSDQLSELEVKTERVRTIDEFVQASLADAQTALDIAGFNALYGIQEYQLSNQALTPDVKDRLISLVKTGSYDGDEYVQINESSLNIWESRIQSLGDLQGVDIILTEPEIAVWQRDPWVVSYNWTSNITYVDDLSNSVWDERIILQTHVQVNRFYEPYSRILGNDNIKVEAAAEGEQTIEDIFADQTFVVNEDAPSYLQRLEGIEEGFTPDGNGIETLVNVDFYQNVIEYQSDSNSAQDWLFFSDTPIEEGDVCEVETGGFIQANQCDIYAVESVVPLSE